LKTDLAYYLIIVYILAVGKPIFPLIQDNFAHIFWNAEHIATVHHHHGEHHAEKEIAEATHEEGNNKNQATNKNSEPVSLHIILQIPNSIWQISTAKQKFKITDSDYSNVSLDKHYPPPKYS